MYVIQPYFNYYNWSFILNVCILEMYMIINTEINIQF